MSLYILISRIISMRKAGLRVSRTPGRDCCVHPVDGIGDPARRKGNGWKIGFLCIMSSIKIKEWRHKITKICINFSSTLLYFLLKPDAVVTLVGSYWRLTQVILKLSNLLIFKSIFHIYKNSGETMAAPRLWEM